MYIFVYTYTYVQCDDVIRPPVRTPVYLVCSPPSQGRHLVPFIMPLACKYMACGLISRFCSVRLTDRHAALDRIPTVWLHPNHQTVLKSENKPFQLPDDGTNTPQLLTISHLICRIHILAIRVRRLNRALARVPPRRSWAATSSWVRIVVWNCRK